MASRPSHRKVAAVVTLVVVGVVAAALATDVQAHARDHHEQTDLAAANRMLSASRAELEAASYDKELATNHQNTLRTSVASTLARLATAGRALSDNDADALFEGASIGTLESCLGGVQSAYQQIAAHDDALAGEDISASSGACLTLAGGTSGGLAYPFDFPDPDVILQLGGRKRPDHRVHEPDQLGLRRECPPRSPRLGRPGCDVGTRRRPDRRGLCPLLRGGRGRPGRR
jgi:hypothetical protein